MKANSRSLALRLEVAFFLFTLTATALFLMGSAQSFTDETLRALFLGIRWLSWFGLVAAVFGLAMWSRHRRRLGAAVILAIGFFLLFGFSLVWGTWIYPDAGLGLW